MKIYINDIEKDIDLSRLHDVKAMMYPNADIVIVNGFPVSDDIELKKDDRLFFIQRGVMPTEEELEQAMVSRHTPGVHEKVKQAHIAIAGLGGLGSNIAIMLARLGIGHLKLIDFDVVEPSNLNRQQYFIEHLGMKKTEAMVDIIHKINPYVTVETVDCYVQAEHIHDMFQEADVVVEAFDKPENKAMLVNEILSVFPEKYLVAASGLASYHSNNSIKTKRITSHFYLVGDDVSAAKPGAGLMAPRATLAAAHQANTVLRILMGELEV